MRSCQDSPEEYKHISGGLRTEARKRDLNGAVREGAQGLGEGGVEAKREGFQEKEQSTT